MHSFFDVHTVFFVVLGYEMSYIEFFSVVAGLVAVWLSAQANIISWPIGLINVAMAFCLYYQVQLYPDMFLQVFFFITNIIGWWRWGHPQTEEADKKHELKISYLQRTQVAWVSITGIAGTALLGLFASKLHILIPLLFQKPGTFPYIDSFIMVMSIIATFLMIQKKIECWILWIIIDIIAVGLYFIKGIKLYSAEYLIFTIIATFGLITWVKKSKDYQIS